MRLLPDYLDLGEFPRNLVPYLYEYGDFRLAVKYAIKLQTRSPILEKRLLQELESSLKSCKVETISSCNYDILHELRNSVMEYVKYVIKGRWEMLEKILLEYKWPLAAELYAAAIGTRWPAGEKIILRDFKVAYYYIESVYKQRWPEFETALLKKLNNTSFKTEEGKRLKGILEDYINYYINGRWKEVEPIINKMSNEACCCDIREAYLAKAINKTVCQIDIRKYFQKN